MKYPVPKGVRRQIIEAVAVLVVISWAAHLVVLWLTPIIPLIVAVALLLAVWSVVFGRRRS